MAIEQLNLDYEKQREVESPREKAIKEAVLDYVKKIENDHNKRKVNEASLHTIFAGYMEKHRDVELTTPEDNSLSLTKEMKDEHIKEILEKIWSVLKPILDEKDWPYKEEKIREYLKKEEKRHWSSIEDSLPENDK